MEPSKTSRLVARTESLWKKRYASIYSRFTQASAPTTSLVTVIVTVTPTATSTPTATLNAQSTDSSVPLNPAFIYGPVMSVILLALLAGLLLMRRVAIRRSSTSDNDKSPSTGSDKQLAAGYVDEKRPILPLHTAISSLSLSKEIVMVMRRNGLIIPSRSSNLLASPLSREVLAETSDEPGNTDTAARVKRKSEPLSAYINSYTDEGETMPLFTPIPENTWVIMEGTKPSAETKHLSLSRNSSLHRDFGRSDIIRTEVAKIKSLHRSISTNFELTPMPRRKSNESLEELASFDENASNGESHLDDASDNTHRPSPPSDIVMPDCQSDTHSAITARSYERNPIDYSIQIEEVVSAESRNPTDISIGTGQTSYHTAQSFQTRESIYSFKTRESIDFSVETGMSYHTAQSFRASLDRATDQSFYTAPSLNQSFYTAPSLDQSFYTAPSLDQSSIDDCRASISSTGSHTVIDYTWTADVDN
jgi:hypothetical protein